MSALFADFLGGEGGAKPAPLKPLVVLAPKKSQAMIEHEKKMAEAKRKVDAEKAKAIIRQSQAKYAAERAKEAKEQAEFERRMMTENTPEAISWRKRKASYSSAGSGGLLGSVLKVSEKAASGAAKGVATAAKATAAATGTVVKATAKGVRTVGKGLAAVPVIGGALKGVYDLTLSTPFQVADKLVKGKPLDKVALSTLKDHVTAVKAVAPYAQTVVSLVPAVGPGLSAGLGAGLALASGASISEAMIEGAAAALPGGALARGAFNVGRAAVEGKPIDQALIDSLPVGKVEKEAIRAGLDATKRIARGENVAESILAQADRAVELLPKETRGALKTGIALAQGKNLQTVAGSAAGAAMATTGTTAAGLAAKGGDVLNLKVKVPKATDLVKQATKPVAKVATAAKKSVASAVPKKAVQTVTKTAASATAKVSVAAKAATTMKPAVTLGKQMSATLAGKPTTSSNPLAKLAASASHVVAGAKAAGSAALLKQAQAAIKPAAAAPKPATVDVNAVANILKAAAKAVPNLRPAMLAGADRTAGLPAGTAAKLTTAQLNAIAAGAKIAINKSAGTITVAAAPAPKAAAPKPAAALPKPISPVAPKAAAPKPAAAAPKPTTTPKPVSPGAPKAASVPAPPKAAAAPKVAAAPPPAASDVPQTQGFFIPTSGPNKGRVILTSAAV